MNPSSQRFKSLAFTMLFSCGLATAVRAEPIRVTGGYIQVGAAVTDFLIETTSGTIGGEQEGVSIPPIISGFSGEVVSLSMTYVGDLGHFMIGGVDLPGRANFEFAAGDVTLPSVDDVLAQPNAFSVFAPFTFTGHVDTFASLTDRDSGASPIAGYDLFGRGTTEAQIHAADHVGRHAAAGTTARGVHDHQSVRGCFADAGAGVDAAGGYRHRDGLCPTAKARGPNYL